MAIFWGDFHTNTHGHQLDQYLEHYAFAKEMVDVWGPVYYPYTIGVNELGFKYEKQHDEETYRADFERLRQLCRDGNDEEMLVFLSYEWQGNGSDGDHNVFFKGYEGPIELPFEYGELVRSLSGYEAIGIPHHTAYMPGHRGKNWSTHNQDFSPVSEIYSSHGSSESSDSAIPLNVHIHMGPRADKGSYLAALKQGIHVGVIASGDNHCCPTISGNGFMGIVAEKLDRETIFEAIKNRHTYAVTRNKIKVDYRLNEGIMGDVVSLKEENIARINVDAGSAIDRIELYKNGEIEKIFPHSGEWEKEELNQIVQFKFEIELGWGPDRRVFPDIEQKEWELKLETKGRILEVEKLWTSPGCEIINQDDKSVNASITTRKNLDNAGKLSQKNYLTPQIQNQSIIIEIEDHVDHVLDLVVDGIKYELPIKELLRESFLFAKEKEAEELLKERYQFTEFYREDPWWHNAYKILIHRAYPQVAYQKEILYSIEGLTKDEDNYLFKVIQKNGDTAWTSPIWIKK